jgi:hypothetical protein
MGIYLNSHWSATRFAALGPTRAVRPILAILSTYLPIYFYASISSLLPEQGTGTRTGTRTGTLTGTLTGTRTGTLTGTPTGTLTGTPTGTRTGMLQVLLQAAIQVALQVSGPTGKWPYR